MKISRDRILILPWALLAIVLPLLAFKCTGTIKTTHDATCGFGEEAGVSGTWGAASLGDLSVQVTPPSWLELKDVSPRASVMLQGKDAAGNALSQALTLPFSAPSARIQAPPAGAIAWDFTPTADQQNAYNSFVALADPTKPESATAGIVVGDIRILAISGAVYQPYELDVRLYQAGSEVGQYVATQSLSGLWRDYLLSAISQVPGDAWAIHIYGKPPYQSEDYDYYKNRLIAKVMTTTANFGNQNATLANTNLLEAMTHLNGNANPTQYVADPAARSNLYSIFQKIQQHVQHVADGVPEAP